MRNQDPLFLLAATLLHALAVGVVWTNAPLSPLNVANSERIPDERLEFDVDLADEKTKPIETQPQAIAHITQVPVHLGRFAPREKTVSSEKDAPIVETVPSTTVSADVWPEEKQPNAALPGLDGKPIWAIPGVLPPPPALGGAIAAAPAPVVPAPPPASTGPLAVALDYLASGNPPSPSARIAPVFHFPAAGTLASALASEVRSSSTPSDSNGIFELVVNANGKLVSVQVMAADPHYRREWDRVAQSITQRFAGQTFPLPDAYHQGSRIRVAITSQMTMPDGTAHGVSMPMPKIPGLPNERDIHIDTLDDRHRGSNALSGVPPTQLAVGISIDFDVSNIGAKRRRVVRTRISAAPLAVATSQGAADPRR